MKIFGLVTQCSEAEFGLRFWGGNLIKILELNLVEIAVSSRDMTKAVSLMKPLNVALGLLCHLKCFKNSSGFQICGWAHCQ